MIRMFLLGTAFAASVFAIISKAEAGYDYSFPPRENNPVITMDVVKNGPGGGTYRCVSVVECYKYVRYAEERGATQGCSKIVIKRNGYPVITREYQ